jgi:hypothetical protein
MFYISKISRTAKPLGRLIRIFSSAFDECSQKLSFYFNETLKSLKINSIIARYFTDYLSVNESKRIKICDSILSS